MSIFSKLFGSIKFEDQKVEEVISSTEETSVKEESLPDPQSLPEAMRYVVQKWGTTYLQNRSLLNILNDFQVLKELPAAKHIIRNMQESGYMEKFPAISNWELESKSIASQYTNEFGAKEDITLYIVQCIGYGLHFCDDIPCMKEPEVINEPTFDEPEEQTININQVQTPPPPLGPYDPKLDLPNYRYPTLDLLKKYVSDGRPYVDRGEQLKNMNYIVDILRNFGVEISNIECKVSPTFTFYEITPSAGTRLTKIKNLEDDIELSLAPHGVRLIVPIPGKGTVGIEVPNPKPLVVSLESIIDSKKFQESTMELPCAIGKTITNEIFMFDLVKAPHLLVAGATGQGKSICLHAIITSLLYKKHPAELKLVLIDPKKIEFYPYSKLKNHFLANIQDFDADPIITDISKAIRTLNSLCKEMDTRYDLLKMAQARNIKEYNMKFINRQLNPEHGHKFMPYIVVIIDEYGDMIMVAGKEVELPIARIAQLARAIGIHMIIATQRPTNNIITGTIKANFFSRIAFRVHARIDSLTILDRPGAQQLIGNGDMLFMNGGEPVRIQGAYVDSSEMEHINDFISQQQGYRSAFELPDPDVDDSYETREVDMQHLDPLFEDAARLIVREQSGSTSLIQRKFAIGYNRAGRLMDQLEKAGIIGEAHGSKPREVLVMDMQRLERMLKAWR